MGRHEDDSVDKVGTAPMEPNGHHKRETTDGGAGYSLFAAVPAQEPHEAPRSLFADLAASISEEMEAKGISMPDDFGISDITAPVAYLGIFLRMRTETLEEDEFPTPYAASHKVTTGEDAGIAYNLGYLRPAVIGKARTLNDPLLFVAEDMKRRRGIGFSYDSALSQYSLSLYELEQFVGRDGESVHKTKLIADARGPVHTMPQEEFTVASYYLTGALQAFKT